MPVLRCFNHHSFAIAFEIKKCDSKENESWAFLPVCTKPGGRAWGVYMCPLKQTCLWFSEVQRTNECRAPSVPRGECVRSQSLSHNLKSWGARYVVKTLCFLIKRRSWKLRIPSWLYGGVRGIKFVIQLSLSFLLASMGGFPHLQESPD